MTKETKESLLSGASMFIEPISEEITPIVNHIDKEYGDCLRYKYKSDRHISVRSYDEFFKEWSRYQIGDILTIGNQEIGTIKSVKVVKLQDIDMSIQVRLGIKINLGFKFNTDNIFKDWYNKQYNNYKDSLYVFLYEVQNDN